MKKEFTHLARQLRKNQTSQEDKLWYWLRAKHFSSLKFRRQYLIGNYIVDFCCPKKKLVIEVDGGGHNEIRQIKADKVRDEWLRSQGFKVLRIWNNEIDENLDGVLEEIYFLSST